ncbi:GTPase HflX [Bacteroidetes bacterium endosymbiont of Geopemphigus sp.]|uniref:GTPase HflX n=1 Tax=Bacteroidetes bacterium endosymbiont of Geopemphigus sp. TaxID=2047937 RepID=UPI000CD1DF20|nr:GTPase HflX [Bacteroidetes bacterium endosymbiont of Geopemphigus sp.]
MIEKKQTYYERVILIGLINSMQEDEKSQECLNELEFLAQTAQAKVYARFTQQINRPHPKTFVGSGKLQEIALYINQYSIDTIIFDDELSTAQLKNLEKLFERKIVDRTQLILDIFAQRAKTSYARTQVELAQYQYLLPRLTRMWTHLERQRGGIGLRGPGETEIETDRRIVRKRIGRLREKLLTIDKQMAVQRKHRGKLVRVALVGYTNVGKSTLMNVLSKSDVFIEDKLFATLDTTVRKVIVKNLPFLLADTVGFIRKLPTSLIESFKSTLDEVRESDILLHVVDISHERFEDHMSSVRDTLAEIKAIDKPVIVIFNKTDCYCFTEKTDDDLTPRTRENISLDEWKHSYLTKDPEHTIFVSAHTGQGLEDLKELLYQEVKRLHSQRFPYDDFLYPMYDEQGCELK